MSARLALASLLWGAQVPEPPPPAALQWTAPASCPDAGAVRGTIERRLGRGLEGAGVMVVARVTREGARGHVLRLQLSVGARSESREFADPSCAALAELVALRVVAAVAPEVREVEGVEAREEAPAVVEVPAAEASPSPASPVAPAPESAGVVAAPRDVPRGRSKRPGGFLGLVGGGVLGVVPGPSGGVGLVGGLLGRRWRVGLRGSAVAPRTVTRELGSLRAGLYVGAVQGCGRLGRGALELPLCAGLEAGVMRGEARVATGRVALASWVAVIVGPGLVWHAGRRWDLGLGLELALALVRPRFELGDGGSAVALFRPPSAASGRVWLGVSLRFGDPW